MTLWTAIMLATLACVATKVLGHAVPPALLDSPAPRRTLDLMTVALLAGLVVVQSLASGPALEVDARVPAVVAAAIMFALRVPFIVVIVVAAVIAALGRAWLGWS